MGVWVGVAVKSGTMVKIGVRVGRAVAVWVALAVAVGSGLGVAVRVGVPVGPGVGVQVGVPVLSGVTEGEGVDEAVAVGAASLDTFTRVQASVLLPRLSLATTRSEYWPLGCLVESHCTSTLFRTSVPLGGLTFPQPMGSFPTPNSV